QLLGPVALLRHEPTPALPTRSPRRRPARADPMGVDPPVGGTFWFQIFIQAPSPEIWSETISGGEEVLARKWGGLFWATSLERIFGGVTALRNDGVRTTRFTF